MTEWMTRALCRGRTGWTEGATDRQAAVLLCEQCPVIAECRQWAGQFEWSGNVVIGGWRAPRGVPKRPPWATWRRSNRRLSDDYLQHLAAEYARYKASGGFAIALLADAHRIAPTTAESRIRIARERGHLPPIGVA